ncbi:Ca(2+)-dependent cysteine protease [Tulasnella sp. 424]|nr:Ca(2+)-dependent cysteine protease [Tulasnella sp. 424]
MSLASPQQLPAPRTENTKKSGTSVIRALERVSKQVSDGLVKGKRSLRQLPVVGPIFSRTLRDLPLKTGTVTDIIITSLSYPGMRHAGSDHSMELNGTKYDFVLLLRHFDYRHEENSVNFTLLNDFEVDFTDSTGVRRVIPKADAGRDSIRITIQRLMRTAEPNAKIAFFFGGHGEYAEVNMMGGNSGADCDFQAIIAGDGRRIYGEELRTWFSNTRYPSVSVTTVFDACHSGGSLSLPYTYHVKGSRVKFTKVSRIRVGIPMVQISAAQPDENAWSRNFSDGYYGQLTYSLVQYLKGNEHPTIEGLVGHLSKCDPDGTQLPQVCCSRKLRGGFSLFKLPTRM